MNIEWKSYSKKLAEGISAKIIRDKFNIYHPLSTYVSINENDGQRLISELNEIF